MFWLVESKTQFEHFSNANWEDVFIEIIPNSYLVHPSKNGICALYIRPSISTKGFIVPLHHSETVNVNITDINVMLHKFNNIKSDYMLFFKDGFEIFNCLSLLPQHKIDSEH